MVNTLEDEAQSFELANRALELYENKLRTVLEPQHNGEAVAIHVDTGDYALGRNHMAAVGNLRTRRARDGRIVVLTIGPPTDADRQFIARTSLGKKA
jgi:hypothetical protein